MLAACRVYGQSIATIMLNAGSVNQCDCGHADFRLRIAECGMKGQKAEGTRQKAAKTQSFRFDCLLLSAFCFLPSALLNPHSAIGIFSATNQARVVFAI